MHSSWDLNSRPPRASFLFHLHHQISDLHQDFKKVMTITMFIDDLDQRLILGE